MDVVSTKKKLAVIDILNAYSGNNPYILLLKHQVTVLGATSYLNSLTVEYILKNHDFEPKVIGKSVSILQWYGEKLQKDFSIDFTPKKIAVLALLGETKDYYHCIIKYRQMMDPIKLFVPKNALLENFLVGDYSKIKVDFERYDRLSSSKKEDRKLLEHQKEAIKFLLGRKKCILADDMGLGKMEPNSSLIPTINGFKKMGDICVGDVIFSSNGEPCNVLKTFPHKNKEIYRVSFSDGTHADCGLEHLWVVRDDNMRRRNKGWKTMSLKEIIESGIKIRKTKSNKYEIPVSCPVKYQEKNFIIKPYILGMCIGDGNLCSGGIVISIPDSEIESVYRIQSMLPDYMTLKEDRHSNCPRYRIIHKNKKQKNCFISEIKRLCLNVHGNDKFIPDEYKFSSISQRIDLLRGLMDSDGTITKERNKIVFCTKSKTLSEDISELVFSLGGIARINSYEHKGRKGIEYQVNIQIKENPFYLTRKKERCNPTFKKYCTKRISSVEYVRNEDATCLMVDSPDHTYLTSKNYIVTHNTTSLSVASIEGNFDSVLIICPASLKTNWKRELMWYVPERDITIIEGFVGKNKPELEEYLGYKVGASRRTVKELQEEAKERGKWVDNRFVIVNFDILDEFYEKPKSRSKADVDAAFENSPMLQYIANKKSLVIIDEAHKLSNNDSGWYDNVKDMLKRANPDSIYLATGTPVTNNPQNYFNLLQLIGAEIADDWIYFSKQFCDARKIPAKGEKYKWTQKFLELVHKDNWYQLTDEQKDELKEYINKHARMITITTGSSNLDELQMKTAHLYLRRLKEDAVELPEKKIHEIFYDLTLEQMFQYNMLWDEYVLEQKKEDPNKELNKELHEGAVYRKYCSNEMVPNTIKLAEYYINRGEKVVIACCYDEELYTLKAHFGDKCVIYNGKMSAKEKDASEYAFMNDDSKMVFIGNIVSAGVGITLTSAHILIFNNIDFVPGTCRQMQDRVHRIGQKHKVDIYYQIFKGTQYEKIWNTVMKKELVINSIIKKEDEK